MNINKFVMLMLVLACTTFTLSGCGGSSDGTDSIDSPAPEIPTLMKETTSLSQSKYVESVITSVSISTAKLSVNFQITDQEGVGINDLVAEDTQFTVAKLGFSPVGNQTGNWQSYINNIEQPGVGIGTEPRLQATSENGSEGAFVNNGDGTYQYTLAQSLDVSDADILAQAKIEQLDLSFVSDRTHRVALQISNAPNAINATFDWNPKTDKTELDGIFTHNIVATQTCNNCHGELAMHGGGRVEVKYCVTCHNPGSTDANSGNTVNFKNMIHKIHRGRDLPSVKKGGVYQIYGFNDSLNDYSNLGYPNDILQCTECHTGNSTANTDQVITVSGDNWREIATQAVCGSCHDDVDFEQHYGGQKNDENCMSCHQNSAVAGSIEDRHRNLAKEAQQQFLAKILSITNTSPGEFPQVQFAITNPEEENSYYDILNDEVWTREDGSSRLMIDISWASKDYTNTGNQGDNANAVEINALATALPVGDGSFTVNSPVAIPDGSLAPNITANGSGAVNVEGHPGVNLGDANDVDIQRIAMTNVVNYFSIDESDGQAKKRRSVVPLENCLSCHGQLAMHGNNRTDNIETCVTCHNPRNTDKRVRDIAISPPSDNKTEESIDFKTMIHGIHGASKRDKPLQIVGYGGFNTHVYNEESIHYPSNVGNCSTCHNNESFTLPLPDEVLATTVSTGVDIQDPADDVVISPAAAICSSCHDTAEALVHMEGNGGSFSTTQADIHSGIVLEQCSVCHGKGRTYAVELMHPVKD
jgi:OmcA/MtrC family decaheme c-type cytochrome